MSVATYLQLVRAPALFSAASNIIAAHLIVTLGQPHWATLFLLVTASVCLYAGGMALNDYFDLNQDRRERSSRPLPSGQISPRRALGLVIALFAAALFVCALLGMVQFMIAILLIGAIVVYDGVAKDTVIGNFIMAVCRYLNWLLGLSTAGLGPSLFLLPIPVFLYVASLTELSRHETGSNASRLPPWVIIGLSAVVAAVFALMYQGILPNTWALAVFALAALPLVVRLLRLNRNWVPLEIQKTISLMIMGIIALDACLAWAAGPWWSGFVVLLLLLPARLTARTLYLT